MFGIKSAVLLPTAALALLILCAGCSQDMWNGSRLKPLSASPIFADGRSSRPLEPDTVSQSTTQNDYLNPPLGRNGVETNTLPFPLTADVLNRGQQRYNEVCVECHGYAGYANGIVVKRGYPAPPSYHTARLRNAPIGHFYEVVTHGYGIMYPYNDRVKAADRWAIAVYIRALQASQNAPLADVPAEKQAMLNQEPTAPTSEKQEPTGRNIPENTPPGSYLDGSISGTKEPAP